MEEVIQRTEREMAGQTLVPDYAAEITNPEYSHPPAVLVVDNNPRSLGHCTSMLESLGYSHHSAAVPRQAFELIRQHPQIQIIVVDAQLPSIDGCALIEEARLRTEDVRPLAAILISDNITADLAIKGLHAEAVDILDKPSGLEAYASALRRAARYLAARRPALTSASLSSLGEDLARIVALLEDGAKQGPGDAGAAKGLGTTLRALIEARRLRSRHFPSELFADPAWDILLDLTRAKLENQQVSVSSVCIAASVPMSTALRWVRQMTEAGLLTRWTDPKDRRRDFIALTDRAATHIQQYLVVVRELLKKV